VREVGDVQVAPRSAMHPAHTSPRSSVSDVTAGVVRFVVSASCRHCAATMASPSGAIRIPPST
jgi:hypothetical protein